MDVGYWKGMKAGSAATEQMLRSVSHAIRTEVAKVVNLKRDRSFDHIHLRRGLFRSVLKLHWAFLSCAAHEDIDLNILATCEGVKVKTSKP